MELVSEGLIFIEIFFNNRWEIVKSLCIFCNGNLCFGDCQFAAVHGWVSCFQRLYLEGRNGFSPLLLIKSDQLYIIKFS